MATTAATAAKLSQQKERIQTQIKRLVEDTSSVPPVYIKQTGDALLADELRYIADCLDLVGTSEAPTLAEVMASASEEELATIPGIGSTTAKRIHEGLNNG